MAPRRENRRRLKLVSGLALALALFGGGVALAAHQTIVGQPDNTYSATTYSTDRGEVGTFQVNGSFHNVTADQTGPDGKPLFRSLTISGGTTAVNGTQYLTQGTYHFFCSVHPTTMQATLVVTGNGTPQPRPHADLRILSKKISKVLKRGLLVEIDMSAKTDAVSLLAKLGKATIGKVNDLSTAAGQQFAVMKLTKSGKSKLRNKSKASVTVTADIPFGSPATAVKKLR